MKSLGLSLVGVIFAISTASAHHSLALFDTNTILTIQGTVKEVAWRSPHTVITMVAKDATGQMVEWRIETTPTSWLTSEGWTRDSVKPGDEINVDTNPYGDRSVHYAWLLRVTKADGSVLLTRFSNRLKTPGATTTAAP